MAPLKDKKKKKKPRPRRLGSKPFVPVFKTGMNRDIPMGGAGGSQNLIANLLASRQAQPSAQVIQTPDQFKLAQDIKDIKSGQADIKAEQAGIAEEAAILKKARKERSDKGTTGIRKVYKTSGNLNKVAGAELPEEEIAVAAETANDLAHKEAGNVVPGEMAGGELRTQPDAYGGKHKGATGKRAPK